MSLADLGVLPGNVETLLKEVPYVSDPLALFTHLSRTRQHAVLLESAEIDSKDHLQSLLLIDAALRLECRGQEVRCKPLSANGRGLLTWLAEQCQPTLHVDWIDDGVVLRCPTPAEHLDEDARLRAPSVFDVLRVISHQLHCLRQHPHAVFLCGVFAYDLLATFEHLPAVAEGDNDCPDYVFYLAETLLTIDHQTQRCELVASIFSGPEVAQNYFTIAQRIEALVNEFSTFHASAPLPEASLDEPLVLKVDKSDDAFVDAVKRLKAHIISGDIFQVVPSRTFSLPCPSPLRAYAHLKRSNPSPYMFYLQDADFVIFGASPESALKYDKASNQVEIYPIAGTRPRGKDAKGNILPDLDSRIELELRLDEKEKAEHLMLVDLARNDVARVSIPGTRHVKDLLKVDRYSHVMHLVSRVVGQLREDLDALHAYQACMNMGTLVGAPKVSAATLIREVEGKRRGSYGGAVGYINGNGDMDTCIVIRSAFVKGARAYIQAGAGVVYDSDPQAEADETRGKAQAVISAIVAAHQRQEV